MKVLNSLVDVKKVIISVVQHSNVLSLMTVVWNLTPFKASYFLAPSEYKTAEFLRQLNSAKRSTVL